MMTIMDYVTQNLDSKKKTTYSNNIRGDYIKL